MDVAVEAVHRRPVERDALARAGRIEAEIEGLAVGEREDVVEDAVVVRQLDRRADRRGEHARHELHVALVDDEPRLGRPRAPGASSHTTTSGAGRPLDFRAAANVGLALTCRDARVASTR